MISIARPPALPGFMLELLRHETFGARVVRRAFDAGELLFRQDEPPDWLFYIESGYVRIFLLAADGRERTVRILGPGDLAGDYSFYLQTHHNTFAEAFDGPVATFQVNRPDLETLLCAYPELYQSLLKSLARTTLALTDIIEGQTFRDLRERVQMALLALAGRHGTVGSSGVIINIHLTHETISTFVGATRTRVSICLSDLQREGFYTVINQRIVISPWAAGLVLPP